MRLTRAVEALTPIARADDDNRGRGEAFPAVRIALTGLHVLFNRLFDADRALASIGRPRPLPRAAIGTLVDGIRAIARAPASPLSGRAIVMLRAAAGFRLLDA